MPRPALNRSNGDAHPIDRVGKARPEGWRARAFPMNPTDRVGIIHRAGRPPAV